MAAAKAAQAEAFQVGETQLGLTAEAKQQVQALEERAVYLRQAHEQSRLALMKARMYNCVHM